MSIRHYAALLLTFALLLAACGDSSGGDPFAEAINDASGGQSSGEDLLEEAIKSAIEDGESSEEDFAQAVGEAIGAGGSGNINFDGVDYPVGSAFCLLESPIDIGTIDDAGWRLLISEVSTGWSVQILDPEFLQWFATDNTIEQNGSSFSGSDTFWNNSNDVTVEASYEVTCP